MRRRREECHVSTAAGRWWHVRRENVGTMHCTGHLHRCIGKKGRGRSSMPGGVAAAAQKHTGPCRCDADAARAARADRTARAAVRMTAVHAIEKRAMRHQGLVNYQTQLLDGCAAVLIPGGGMAVNELCTNGPTRTGNPRTMHAACARRVPARICRCIDRNKSNHRVGSHARRSYHPLMVLLLSHSLVVHGCNNCPRICCTLQYACGG